MKKGDFLVVALALILMVSWLMISHKGGVAAIYVDGELYKKVPLNENATVVVESDHGKNTVVIKNSVVTVTDSSCDNKLCEAEHISETAHSIVCLPNRFSVIIEDSNEKDETDVIL